MHWPLVDVIAPSGETIFIFNVRFYISLQLSRRDWISNHTWYYLQPHQAESHVNIMYDARGNNVSKALSNIFEPS